MIRVFVMSHLDPMSRREVMIPHGATAEEIVATTLPTAPRARVRMLIVGHDDDHVIDAALWVRLRPKAGTTVVVRVVLAGDSARALLTVGATIAAMAIAGPLLAPFGTLVQTVGVAAAALGTQLLINALIPVKQEDSTSKDIYSISGFQNELDPGGYVPLALGTIRWAPPYAATPYTQGIGDDRYIIAAFNGGYGPLEIEEPRIGDTPITKYKNFDSEFFEGYDTDDQMTIYSRQIVEESQSIQIKYVDERTTLFTKIDGVSCSFDVTFAQGLYAMTTGTNAKQIPMSVAMSYGYRDAGSTDEEDWIDLSVALTAKSTQPIMRTISIEFPTRGQYELKWKRNTLDYDDLDSTVVGFAATSRSDLTAVRTIRPEYPINFSKPIALGAVRIKGSGQLNGMLDNFSWLTRSVVPDYDYATGTWIERATDNPASLFRWVATGPANPRPINLGDDLTWLEDWHDYCRTKGLTFSAVWRDEASVDDRLAEVAAAGRAVPQDFGGYRGVIIDRPRSVVAAHITPRNSWGMEWEQAFATLPDAWRIQFADQTNEYASAERIVPLPHFTGGEPQLIQDLTVPGVTDPDLIWRHGRWRGYEALYRRRRYTCYQDHEHLVATRGDMVKLSHYMITRTQVAARVVDVTEVPAGVLIRLDEQVTMEAGSDYAVRYRLADCTSVLRTVVTQAGTTNTIMVGSGGTLPEVGDLAMFGLAGEETIEAIILDVEMQDNLAARLTLTNHAPEIETLTDAETPPTWSGRVGVEAGATTIAPGIPIISVTSGDDAVVTGGVVVGLSPGTGVTVPVSYEVDHRLSGGATWTTVTVDAAAGSAILSGYATGNVIEVRARAQGANEYWSDYTSTVTHTVEVYVDDTLDGSSPVLMADFVSGTYTISGSAVLATAILTREGAAKTVIGADGGVETVPADTLAYDWSTGQRRLVLEGQATNLFVGSDAPTVAQNITVTAQTYTISFLGAGPMVLSGSHSATVTGVNNSTRTTYTFTPTAGTLTLTPSGTVRRVQVEVGAIATSYIETTTTTVTRVADVCAWSSAAVAALGDSGVGPNTLAWRGWLGGYSSLQDIVSWERGGVTKAFVRMGTTSTSLQVITPARPDAGIDALSLVASYPGEFGLAVGWGASGMAVSLNGGAVQSGAHASGDTIDAAYLGGMSGYPARAVHRVAQLVIWPIKGSSAAVQSQAHLYGA